MQSTLQSHGSITKCSDFKPDSSSDVLSPSLITGVTAGVSIASGTFGVAVRKNCCEKNIAKKINKRYKACK